MSYLFLNEVFDDLQIESVIADADRGGWNATLRTMQDTAAIVKWQTVQLLFRFFSLGWDEEYRTAMVGHALPIGLDFDFLASGSRFDVATSHRFLERMSLQGIGFTDRSLAGPPPYHDHQILDMRLGHIVRHILYEHCNICEQTNPEGWVDCSDIDVTNSTRVNRYNVHATANAWSTLQNIARNEFYYIYFSKDNAVHYIPHPLFAAVIPTPVMEFTADFCAGRPTVHVRAEELVSQVILKAVNEDGTVFTSKYPASPADEGTPKPITNIRVGGPAPQIRLDELAERQYVWERRNYTVEWPAPGWAGFFFELLDRVEVTYVGTAANGVHLNWINKRFWIHRIQMSPGPAYSGSTVFTLEEEEPDVDLYYFV